MDPQNVGTGQFGQAIGGADALKAAMSRRGIDTSMLDQISPAAPGPESPVAPALPEGTQIGAPQQQLPTQPTGGAPGPQEQPFRSSEMALALKAMNSVISTENSVIKSALSLGLR